jgi:hypothetical protein
VSVGDAGLAVVLALLLGVLVPWAFMKMLVPALESSERARVVNYRGREVFLGLGVSWLVWSGCAILIGVAATSLLFSRLQVFALAGLFALVAFALGLLDDALGSSDSRGFRGHLRAVAHGRITTGGMKLIGIGLASFVVGFALADIAPWGGNNGIDTRATMSVSRIGLALLAGAAMALTSNFVNLMDLRPGRALKTHSLLAVIGVISLGWGLRLPGTPAGFTAAHLLEVVALALVALGPVFATWRFDLGERGMLGDAGANPAGAVAGMLIVIGLPLWGLIAYFVLMLVLNLASERVSFSTVIEGNSLLRRLDAHGRAESSFPGPSAETPER